jgi:hypothetical protein
MQKRAVTAAGGQDPVTAIQLELWVDRGAAAVVFYTEAFGATMLHGVGEGEDIVAITLLYSSRFSSVPADSPSLFVRSRWSGAAWQPWSAGGCRHATVKRVR